MTRRSVLLTFFISTLAVAVQWSDAQASYPPPGKYSIRFTSLQTEIAEDGSALSALRVVHGDETVKSGQWLRRGTRWHSSLGDGKVAFSINTFMQGHDPETFGTIVYEGPVQTLQVGLGTVKLQKSTSRFPVTLRTGKESTLEETWRRLDFLGPLSGSLPSNQGKSIPELIFESQKSQGREPQNSEYREVQVSLPEGRIDAEVSHAGIPRRFKLTKYPQNLYDGVPVALAFASSPIRVMEFDFRGSDTPNSDRAAAMREGSMRLSVFFESGARSIDESTYSRMLIGHEGVEAIGVDVPVGTAVAWMDAPATAIQYVWDGEKAVPLVPTTQIAALDEAIRNAPMAKAPAPEGKRYDWKTISILATLAVLFTLASVVLFRKPKGARP